MECSPSIRILVCLCGGGEFLTPSVQDFHTSMSFALNPGFVSELVQGGD